MKRTILSKPDSLGRVMYLDEWHDPDKPYCGVCGTDPAQKCKHAGTIAYGQCAQIFFAKISQAERKG